MAEDIIKPGTPEHAHLLERIHDARTDRAHFAPTWNDFIAMACPWKPRVSTHNTTAIPEGTEDQFEIFDSTLQDAVSDFAAAEHDELTPEYKPWTKHELNEEMFEGRQAQLEQARDVIDQRVKAIYAKIRESAYSEIASELFTDLAMMNGMISVPMAKAFNRYVVEYVPAAEQLVEAGVQGGVDLRARERPIRVRNLDRLFPKVNWDHIAPKQQRVKDARRQVVTEGCYPDWGNEQGGETRWIYFIIQGGKVRYSRDFYGDAACPLIPIRTNVAAPTGYSVGPGIKALAPARTLNQLSYDELYRIDKSLRPPLIYDQDRVFDPDGSLEPGRSYARMKGTQIEEMYPQGNGGEAFFKRDELKLEIRRALYVDKPDQRGKTPPTAAQWVGEQAEASRRTVMHRARIQRELVLALVRRFEWIMERNGELQPIKVDGKVVQVKSISALSRAADLESAQMTMQTLSFAAGTFGPEALAQTVDVRATMERLKARTGDENLVMLPPQENPNVPA